MRPFCFVFLLSLIAFPTAFTQENESSLQFIFLPGKLAVQPLTAAYQEPKVGLRKEIGSSKMKVEIGASVDMLELQPASDSTEFFRVGIDFFTYALSTSADGLRLQIDAVDGFFGGHVAYVNDLDETDRLILRLRLLHLSAHFLDGHFNNATQTWKDNRPPIPFTRDFGELIAVYRTSVGNIQCQPYVGFSYATLIRPTEIERTELHAGVEFWTSSLVESVFNRPFNIFLAHHLTVRRIQTSVATNNIDFGLKFGEWRSTGLKIYMSYFNGLDVFSQYYDVRRENWGIGFAFDFW